MKGTAHTSTEAYNIEQVIKITHIIASHYGISVNDLCTKSQKGEYVISRQLVWKITREIYGNGISYMTIGRVFGRKHSTVIQGIRSITDQIDTNRIVNKDYRELLLRSRESLKIKDPSKPNQDLIKKLERVLGCSTIVSAKITLREVIKDLKH